MERNERLLLSYLRLNGRMKLTRMSKMTGIPVSTLHDRLQKTSHVHKICALLHFARMGYNAKAYVLLKGNRRYRDRLQYFLEEHPHVNNLYKINNGYDYLMECVFTDMRALEDFMEELDEKFRVRTTNVHYIIDDIKREKFFADPVREAKLAKEEGPE